MPAPYGEGCRERWPSGLRRTLGKRVYGKPYRGFESHSLRQSLREKHSPLNFTPLKWPILARFGRKTSALRCAGRDEKFSLSAVCLQTSALRLSSAVLA